MKLHFDLANSRHYFDSSQAIDISIPLHFNGEQPRSFGAPQASGVPLRMGGFVGDTQQGGSCNVGQYNIIPHCNGTHTECVGHIVNERASIIETLKDSFSLATLVTVSPVPAQQSGEHCRISFNAEDLLITGKALSRALETLDNEFAQALVIRTKPNPITKRQRNYIEEPAAFLSIEAMQLIVQHGFTHLLLDVPSLDRANDEGILTAHHIFWGVPEGERSLGGAKPSLKTVSEFLYIPDEVKDGKYALTIEIAPFVADVSPSRIRLFEVRKSL